MNKIPDGINVNEERTNQGLLERILEEQTIIFVREGYSHLFSLARTTITLNVVTLIAASVLYRLTLSIGTDKVTLASGDPKFYFCFGLLIAMFGVIFNLGACFTFFSLSRNIRTFCKYWQNYLSDDHFLREPYLKLALWKKGVVHYLTFTFYMVCASIWLFLGGYLVHLALK